MWRYAVGFFWASIPLILLGLFYCPYDFAAHSGLYGADAYQAGLLYLLMTLLSCFACPIPLAVWFFDWRDKVSMICFIASILGAVACMAVLYFDPGHKIYAFLAD